MFRPSYPFIYLCRYSSLLDAKVDILNVIKHVQESGDKVSVCTMFVIIIIIVVTNHESQVDVKIMSKI